MPGVSTDLLSRIARSVIYTDKRLAQRLPASPDAHFSGRRNVSAWICFSDRVVELQKQLDQPDAAVETPLQALANGLMLTGVADLLRCITLELIAAETGLREELASLNPEKVLLAQWNLDDTVCLARTRKNKTTDCSTGSSVASLLEALNAGLRSENRNYKEELSQITPLGWCIAAGMVSGTLRSDLRLGLLSAKPLEQKAVSLFSSLAQFLAAPMSQQENKELPDESDPWKGLYSLLNQSCHEQARDFARQLELYGREVGLVVSEPRWSKRFSLVPAEYSDTTAGSGRRTWEVSLGVESFQIEPWRIATASTRSDTSGRKAECRNIDGDQFESCWTETRLKGKLISVHIAQPGIASLAGFADKKEEEEETHVGQVDSAGDPISEEPAATTTDNTLPKTSPQSIGPEEPEGNTVPLEMAFSDTTYGKQLTSEQEKSWNGRSKATGSHYKRIAFLQLQVEPSGSYRHPVYECSQEKLDEVSIEKSGEIPKKKWEYGKHPHRIDVFSPVERRRRRILTEVLRACELFKVDFLVLPEYSTRPETVNWIQRQLDDRNTETIVWAGTFRLPPGFDVENFPWLQGGRDWASVLPVVGRPEHPGLGDPSGIITRHKKYPSVAYNEIFNPSSGILSAISHESTRITELICSEIFLAMSPANLLTLSKTFDALFQRFGRKDLKVGVEDYVLKDVLSFSDQTSLCSDEGRVGEPAKRRRSILFVPSMTPRTVDYAILGQANHLASGMTTVFCNDSGCHSRGQSCFIGEDGWDNEKRKEVPGIPGAGPYHGLTPGFFHQFQADRGWLGADEQAMVIADVDPTHQFGGKPRPQNLLPPLEMVAHLPILEVGGRQSQVDEKIKFGRLTKLPTPDLARLVQILPWPEGLDWGNQKASDMASRKFVVDRVLQGISKIISDPPNPVNTISDSKNHILARALLSLAYSVPENSGWLKRRAEAYKAQHASNPMPYPPPVATDWLYVDLDEDRLDDDESILQVPPVEIEPAQKLSNQISSRWEN